jgi:hypothetical protein
MAGKHTEASGYCNATRQLLDVIAKVTRHMPTNHTQVPTIPHMPTYTHISLGSVMTYVSTYVCAHVDRWTETVLAAPENETKLD